MGRKNHVLDIHNTGNNTWLGVAPYAICRIGREPSEIVHGKVYAESSDALSFPV
jgi:hypothetical protein